MSVHEPVFVMDVPSRPLGEHVSVTGDVIGKRRWPDYLEITLRDATGRIRLLISNDVCTRATEKDQSCFHKKTRLKVLGSVSEQSGDLPILSDVSEVHVLGKLNSELEKLDSEMREQASRMLMSRIRRSASQFLQDECFVEFESKVISSRWDEEGLEPLRVVYPGFGAPVTLATSPSAQLMEFLVTTQAQRAFTVSTSFTSTYRFLNGAAETRIVMAKANDLTASEHEKIIWEISKRVISQFDNNVPKSLSSPVVVEAQWPGESGLAAYSDFKPSNELTLIRYKASIPAARGLWSTHVDTIMHVVDRDSNLLVEGYRESLRGQRHISSLCLYPAQFLGLLRRAPARQLIDLGRFNVWDG